MDAAQICEVLGGRLSHNNDFFYANCPAHNDTIGNLTIMDVGNGIAECVCGNGCSKRAIQDGIDRASGKKPKADMSWTDAFTVSKQEVEEMSDPDWVYENLIIQGHILAIPAPANGGKTTILQYVCAQISDSYTVYYVNADISGGDAKWAYAHAEQHRYTLMLPDMKAGLSMDDVVTRLELMNEIEADYSGNVFIFDTLKKMTDVINKSRAKELFKTLRGLSAKSMTIVLLSHTNKYKDVDGNYIYEGTGDLRTDVDDLIYMIPKKNENGTMTVSTQPDKVRGTFTPITFEISADREVTALDTFIDVASIKQAEEQREKDETVIEAITEAIEKGEGKQTEITAYCKDNYDIGWRTVDKVLHKYRFDPIKLWTRQKLYEKNAWQYSLNPAESAPPDRVVKVKTGEGGETGETDKGITH